ncbi:hypothetical protein N7462_010412 [Penicillium macrosclerotiorum]|uniref:uncharacterized protein n=1 Tax=Penicillium macrosclerotiorum TaxID=303699 RepID=UPI0025467BBE|nr:uncharacterized protein N7462_010412 [Penicillium macrosclerotiorum]KAJ5669342.1 hypothetical protein N7462_010412 [Penicillium macrosclerotiorum]
MVGIASDTLRFGRRVAHASQDYEMTLRSRNARLGEPHGTPALVGDTSAKSTLHLALRDTRNGTTIGSAIGSVETESRISQHGQSNSGQ